MQFMKMDIRRILSMIALLASLMYTEANLVAATESPATDDQIVILKIENMT